MDHKKAALEFLKLVIAGRIDEAYAKHVDMRGKHHNVHTSAGFQALRKGMAENEMQMPNKKFTVKNVLADGNLVAVHSHVVLPRGGVNLGAVHMFRFEGGKIAEMWDVAQMIPADSPNKDGAF